MVCMNSKKSYLLDKVLAESWSDPFSSVNPTVHPDHLLLLGAAQTDLSHTQTHTHGFIYQENRVSQFDHTFTGKLPSTV